MSRSCAGVATHVTARSKMGSRQPLVAESVARLSMHIHVANVELYLPLTDIIACIRGRPPPQIQGTQPRGGVILILADTLRLAQQDPGGRTLHTRNPNVTWGFWYSSRAYFVW